MGEAFRDLYATVDEAVTAEDNPEDVSRVFDRASDLVCSKCKNKSECWNKSYMDTLAVFNDTVDVIRERGLLQLADLAHDGDMLQRVRRAAQAILEQDPLLTAPQNALLLEQLHLKSQGVVDWSAIS